MCADVVKRNYVIVSELFVTFTNHMWAFRHMTKYIRSNDFGVWRFSFPDESPSTLSKRTIMINESKTEEYEIIRQGNEK